MKLLVCVDGSEQSGKALDKALDIAGGCSVDEVALINVYEEKYDLAEKTTDRLPFTHEDVRAFEKIGEQEKEDRKALLNEAAAPFKQKNIKTEILAECGHPAETISRVADEGNYDMIIMGRRGMGDLQKLFLGSVSNAVLQEADCSVLVVK